MPTGVKRNNRLSLFLSKTWSRVELTPLIQRGKHTGNETLQQKSMDAKHTKPKMQYLMATNNQTNLEEFKEEGPQSKHGQG